MIEPAKPWVTRTSPANAAPMAPNSTPTVSARVAPDPAPLDEHVLGLERADPAEPDLDLVGGHLADPAPVDAERRGGRRRSDAGSGSSDEAAGVVADDAVMGDLGSCVRERRGGVAAATTLRA